MRLIAVSKRKGKKGTLLVTAQGLNVVVPEDIDVPSMVDVDISRFWGYKDGAYASGNLLAYMPLFQKEAEYDIG